MGTEINQGALAFLIKVPSIKNTERCQMATRADLCSRFFYAEDKQPSYIASLHNRSPLQIRIFYLLN